MNLRSKNAIYTALLLIAMFVVWKVRQGNQTPLVTFSGRTMGPIVYTVKYFDQEGRNFQTEVDSLLKDFNQSLNTYIPDSEISTFNRDSSFSFSLPYFYPVLAASQKIYNLSSGAYDPTIMPLVSTWGFGPEKNINMDSSIVDSLKNLIGFEKIKFNEKRVDKLDSRVTLDFSASAKGYGVDVVNGFLKSKGITNALVEIGGEVVSSGVNLENDKPWAVGILNPNSDELNQFYIAIVDISDRAMATSGNYFNYHIVDGVKYSHTISPFSGYPIIHSLLSASVFADNCMEADALATAFMVLGYEKAIEILEQHPEYDAYLVLSDDKGNLSTYATEGIKPFLTDVQ
ncbi:MAG: FAD:protein FMN transferase [Bacteroidota bacterium]